MAIAYSYYETYRMIEGYGSRIAMRYYDEAAGAVREITYSEFAADIRKMVRFLRTTVPDIQGKNIGVLTGNCYHFVVAYYGIELAGGVLVPMNIQSEWEDILYQLQLVQPACILHDGLYQARVPAIRQSYGGILYPVDAYTACEQEQEMVNRRNGQDLAAIMFTSGTTGRSKGVMLSENNVFAAMVRYWECPQNPDSPFKLNRTLKGQDFIGSLFMVLPMYHVAAFSSLLSWMVEGQTINICMDARNFYRDITAMPSDVMTAVPTIVKSIYSDVMSGHRERLGRLWELNCGAAVFPVEMLRALREQGFVIMQAYGMTETCAGGTWNNDQSDARLRSVGTFNANCQYKLDGGELCLKGGPVTMGYYKDPEATAEVMDADGWLHTGDIAEIDAEGYVYITGRKKNLIILASGENVSPEELEGKIGKCPDVLEVLAKEKGDKICAVIHCDPARQDAVRAFVGEVNRSLPMYKRVNVIEFSDTPLPRNTLGKLLRK